METLKEYSELLKADPRQPAFVIANDTKGLMKAIKLRDYHDIAKRSLLHQGVPSEVSYHFENARNLLVYSYYYYPFYSMAQFFAFIAVEAALRIKAGKPKRGFTSLFREAVRKKWIRDEGFTLGGPRKSLADAVPRSFCDVLSESIPRLRNTFAHGELLLINNGATTMQICAELINQLFQKPSVNVGPATPKK